MKKKDLKKGGLVILKMLPMIMLIIANIFLLRTNSQVLHRMDLMEKQQNTISKRHGQGQKINWRPGVLVHHLAPLDTIFVRAFSITEIQIPDVTPTGVKTSNWCTLIQGKFHKDFEQGYFELGLSVGAYKNKTTEYIILTFSDGSTSKYFVRYLPAENLTNFQRKHPTAYQI